MCIHFLNFSRVSYQRFAKYCSIFLIGLALVAPAASYAAKKDLPAEKVQSKVNINSANAELLASVLAGIGMKKAEAIVSYRKAHGKFKKIEDLAKVKGIGESTIDKNRGKLLL